MCVSEDPTVTDSSTCSKLQPSAAGLHVPLSGYCRQVRWQPSRCRSRLHQALSMAWLGTSPDLSTQGRWQGGLKWIKKGAGTTCAGRGGVCNLNLCVCVCDHACMNAYSCVSECQWIKLWRQKFIFFVWTYKHASLPESCLYPTHFMGFGEEWAGHWYVKVTRWPKSAQWKVPKAKVEWPTHHNIHLHTHTHTHNHITHTPAYTRTHGCVHTHTYICPHVRAHTHTYTRMHAHTFACMYAYTHICTHHTHTYTHTHWAGLWQFWRWWAGTWLIWGFWAAGWLEGVLRPMSLHYAGMTWCRARSPLSAEPTGGGHCTRMWWCPHSVSEHHVDRIESRQEEKWTKKGQKHNGAGVPIRNKMVISIAPCIINTALYKTNKNVLIKPKKSYLVVLHYSHTVPVHTHTHTHMHGTKQHCTLPNRFPQKATSKQFCFFCWGEGRCWGGGEGGSVLIWILFVLPLTPPTKTHIHRVKNGNTHTHHTHTWMHTCRHIYRTHTHTQWLWSSHSVEHIIACVDFATSIGYHGIHLRPICFFLSPETNRPTTTHITSPALSLQRNISLGYNSNTFLTTSLQWTKFAKVKGMRCVQKFGELQTATISLKTTNNSAKLKICKPFSPFTLARDMISIKSYSIESKFCIDL